MTVGYCAQCRYRLINGRCYRCHPGGAAGAARKVDQRAGPILPAAPDPDPDPVPETETETERETAELAERVLDVLRALNRLPRDRARELLDVWVDFYYPGIH